ncbi:hypothetical protein RN001_012897 [Aquatica leii]|uniref:BHLH domain-containing protein n=1 Tax=Aquatica leii TaxID=1421715 RepID=A0AAN7NZ07_9COLE|nr:hypothetical protein RN001_012897 [Aquatica leii]
MTHKKEPNKYREWEKIRRDKLNSSFTVLSKLLPNHDPSLNWSKLDILQKASQYIEELQVKLKNVLTTEGVNKTKRCEIKTLYSRIKKLLLRNEQLCNLLKDAGIKIPSDYGSLKNFRQSLHWANKITPEQAKKLENEETQKENTDTNKTVKVKRNLKKGTAVAVKHRKSDAIKNKLTPIRKKPSIISLQLSNVVPLPAPQPLQKLPNPSCFIITNKPLDLSCSSQQKNKMTKASTVVTNSSSLAAPKMASTIKPSTSSSIPKVTTTTLNTLGPGTLILANGNIVPILPPSTVLPAPTILTNSTPILLKPPTNNTTLIVMPTNVSQGQTPKSTTTSTNTTTTTTVHQKIRPKINITCTTQANKVPIPALASKYSDYGIKKKLPESKPQNLSKKVKRKVTTTTQNKRVKIANKSQPTVSSKKVEDSVDDKNVQKEIDKSVENASSGDTPKSQEVPSEVPKKVTETNADKSNVDNNAQNNSAETNVASIPDKEKDSSSTPNPETTCSDGSRSDQIKNDQNPPEAVAKTIEIEKIDIPVTTPTSSVITSSTTDLTVNLNHSELSNDIFSTLQVPIGGQNPESTSPTAAFLLAFPLVSSLTGVKVTEVIEEENSDSRHGTPTLLQIGTMDTTKTTQSIHADSLTPNLLNLDNFSFFSGSNFYSSFDNANCPIIDKTSSACAKTTDQAPTKSAKVPETTISQNINTNPPLYTSAQPVISKPNLAVSNSFLQQNTSVSYTKPSPAVVSSTYTHVTMPQLNCPPTTHKPTETQYTAASVAQCNAFNPFSDFSKPNSYATFSKPYNDPLYTNSSYTYPHHNENNFNQNMYYPPKPTKPINNTYNASNYPDSSYNVTDNRKRHGSYYNQSKPPTKHASSKSTKTANTQPKPPINWMTTPDFRPQPTGTDYLVPPIDYTPNTFYSSNSFVSTTHSTYFNSTSSMYSSTEFQNSISDNRKTFDSSLPILPTGSSQRNEFEENQFSWSPTKLPQFLETPHTFVSSTLPTLVGDLALGTQVPFTEQKLEQSKPKESNRRTKGHSVGYDNQSNFLSVSQLVENKTEPSAARTTNRRNSGNRSLKNNSQKSKASQKQTENKEILDSGSQALAIEKKPSVNYTMQSVGNSSWISDCNKPNRHSNKNPQSSYSAEALIGHQETSDNSIPKQRYRQQSSYATTNKALPIPTFLSDNIVPYFPPVEISQDNNFMQTNSNYQSFNASVQNNSYSSTGPTITSNYLQPTGLIPEFQNYSSMITEADKVDNKHCNRTDSIKQTAGVNESEERSNMHHVHGDCSGPTNNFIKKSKHKQPNESNLPGIVDFGFLSMPNAINSPILPDDFHTHSNFLPPPTPSQLYPCKNPLYAKQSSELLSLPPVPVARSSSQNFDGPSSSVTGNAGSSLTSFNLSAIFPEINKGSVPLPGLYPDPSRNKNYNFQRNYIGSSVQVFPNKPTTSSSYANPLATSYAPSNQS